MRDLTNAETALLGLLAEGPKHPYQVEIDVRQRDMRFWTDLSMSSIYKLLRKLEKDNLVSAETEISEENRARKVYSVSKDGLNVLRWKVRKILSVPEHMKWQMDLAISNLAVIKRDKAIVCLEEYKLALEKKIQDYGKLDDYLKSVNCVTHKLALSRRPIRIFEGEIKWVKEYLEELKNEVNNG